MRMICGVGLCLTLCSSLAEAAVQTKVVKYQHGSQECVGFLAWDDAQEGKRPGVLVVHEWWGLNDHAKDRAKKLAELGYVAFCADMYGDGKVVEHPKDAGAMAMKVRDNVDDWRKRAQAALKTLAAQPQVDGSKLAAIGYCFGGSTCLQLAYTGADLKAVATFHAALPAPTADEAKAIQPEIAVFHGADDKFIPEDAIKAFRSKLDDANVDYEFIAYPGAVHSFTVPDAGKHNVPGLQYLQAADEDSWKQMRELFQKTLK